MISDRALWATWYNLPAGGRDAYLAWLHGSYIPKLLEHPGIVSAAHYACEKITIPPRIRHTEDPAVPRGNDYILIFGGKSSHAFSKGTQAFASRAPSKLDANLTAEDRTMLALRSDVRVSIFTEEARIDGPEAKQRVGETALSPCIQFGSFNGGSSEADDELLAWYADWRMPALAKLPGCVGMRKLVSVSGWAQHGVIYEFVSLEARNKYIPTLAASYPEMEAWTNAFIPKLTHAFGSPHVAQRIWPAINTGK